MEARLIVGGCCSCDHDDGRRLPACLHTFPSCLSSDYLFKLLLIGDSGVGKSCLLLRFAVSRKPTVPSVRGPGWWREGEGATQSTVVTRTGAPRMKLQVLSTEQGHLAGKLGAANWGPAVRDCAGAGDSREIFQLGLKPVHSGRFVVP